MRRFQENRHRLETFIQSNSISIGIVPWLATALQFDLACPFLNDTSCFDRRTLERDEHDTERLMVSAFCDSSGVGADVLFLDVSSGDNERSDIHSADAIDCGLSFLCAE